MCVCVCVYEIVYVRVCEGEHGPSRPQPDCWIYVPALRAGRGHLEVNCQRCLTAATIFI